MLHVWLMVSMKIMCVLSYDKKESVAKNSIYSESNCTRMQDLSFYKYFSIWFIYIILKEFAISLYRLFVSTSEQKMCQFLCSWSSVLQIQQ